MCFYCVSLCSEISKNQKHLLCIDLQGKNIYYLNIAPNMFTGTRCLEILRRKRTNESDFNSWIFNTYVYNATRVMDLNPLTTQPYNVPFNLLCSIKKNESRA